jgi:hypothetical protein
MGVDRHAIGLNVAGLGMGVGGDLKGITITGLGLGVGGDIAGITIAGLGYGAGREIKGLNIAGLGMKAPIVTGVSMGLASVRGYEMTGFCASVYNKFEDRMQGVSIGIVNITSRLEGVQLGLVNIVHDNPKARRILPIINWGG